MCQWCFLNYMEVFLVIPVGENNFFFSVSVYVWESKTSRWNIWLWFVMFSFCNSNYQEPVANNIHLCIVNVEHVIIQCIWKVDYKAMEKGYCVSVMGTTEMKKCTFISFLFIPCDFFSICVFHYLKYRT